MAKMRVHELAKELEIENKKVIEVLEKNGIEGKSHASGLEENEIVCVRKALTEKTEAKDSIGEKVQEIEKTVGSQENGGDVHKKKKNIIFVSNPHNSKLPGSPMSKPLPNPEKRPAKPAKALSEPVKTDAAAAEKRPEPVKPAETVSARPVETVAVKSVETMPVKPAEAPVKQTEAVDREKPVKAELKAAEADKPESKPEAVRAVQPQGQGRTYSNNQNRNSSYNNNNNSQNRGNYNNNGQGGYQGNNQNRGSYNNNGQGGYQGNNQNRGSYSNSGQGGYQGNNQNRGSYNNSGQGGYQGNNQNRGSYNNSGQGGYQGNNQNRGSYSNSGQGGYQGNNQNRGSYNNSGQGGYQGNNQNRGSYNNNGQGGYQGNNQNRSEGGNSYGGNRPSGNRPYNQRGTQDYNNNNSGAGNNRPYNNNERFQRGDGREDNRYGKPQGAKSFSSDSPIIQPEKRRDEAKRKLGQEKDNRSRRDKIYEEDTLKAKPGKFIKPEKKIEELEEQIKVIVLPESLTIKELADKMKIQPSVIVKKLFLQGKIVTVNQEVAYETAEEIALEYDIICEKEVKIDVIEELLKEDDEDEAEMTNRPPVICVMGHVDHGKTSLLDAIRKTNVTDREAGGITQHIGAYTVTINDQKITFLDTPGHEAFTAMRMRGANATDIAILVVAADDGVMPQTIEAINHAKAAGIEIIVAVNKIDKPNANMDRVKQELAEYELIPEDWGGSTVFAPVSAKTGDGIPQLLEMIILTAEILELKANAKREARGLVIEAQLDKGRGPVATILVQKGTLHVGDFIAAGSCHGKVRAMIDDRGRRVKEAEPSTPVEILGLNDVPNAGDVFVAPNNDKEAKQFADTFISQHREKMLEDTKAKMSLDDLFTQIQAGNLKELNLIIKADVQGSVEAVKQSLQKLSNEEVVVKVIHGGVGAINESDVSLASASQAIIIGFNVRPDATAKATSEREGVDIRLYKVIYQAIEDVEAAMKGMLDPVFEEKIIGHAEVRQIFKASAVGNISGSYILDGHFQRDCKVRITREGEQIYEGQLESLKRFKDDVKEVKAGFECGLVFEGFDQIQELDIVEAYIMVEVPR